MKRCFEDWYASEIQKQLEKNEYLEDEEPSLKPSELSFLVLKGLGAKWLVEMFEYIRDNQQIIVHGVIRSGITATFDGDLQSEILLSDDSESNCSVDSSDSEVEC